jgi:hypothetical protein
LEAPGSPYTLMRLASLVPAEIPVEIWDKNLYDLPMDTLGEGDLVDITSKTITIERAEQIARCAIKQGVGVVDELAAHAQQLEMGYEPPHRSA